MAENSTEEIRPLLERIRTGSTLVAVAKGHAPAYSLTKWQRRCACGAILLAVMFERLTFYGVDSNLVMFLNDQPFGWQSYDAANASFIFLGVSFVFSVLGGLLADTLLGRFKTILSSFVVYIVGVTLLVIVGYSSSSNSKDRKFLGKFCGQNIQNENYSIIVPAVDNNDDNLYCGWAIYLSLVVIAIAAGSVRSNLSPFGGDQVRYEGPEVMRTFFNWFYWAINVGSLMAFAGVTAIQQNLGFFVGFLVPLASLIIATVIFSVGRTWYLSRKPMGSVLTNTSRIIIQAFKKRKSRKKIVQRQDSNELFSARTNPSFLDMAKVRFGGSFHDSMVDDVKSLKKIILVFLGLVPYWVVYFQMQTTFLIQGLHMRFEVHAGSNCSAETGDKIKDFQMPPAWLTLFDVIAVLILLPLFDRILYPWLDRHGVNFTLLRRMIIGMLFSVAAMMVAGVLEHYRLDLVDNNKTILQFIGNGTSETSFCGADIWIFWQIPQYTLIGISEVFASVAGLEFAYSMAPRSMQGLIMGIFYMSSGIGAFIGSAILKVASIPAIQWFNNKKKRGINHGRLDLYFFLLGAFQFVALVIFSAVAIYHERQEARQRLGSTAINNKNHHDDGVLSSGT